MTTPTPPTVAAERRGHPMTLTEHQLQASIMAECALRANQDPLWGMIFAIPNGGKRGKAEAGRFKAEGVKAGVPDLFVAVPAHGCHGMFLELKVGRNKLSAEQRDWYMRLREQGYYCTVVWDSPAAAITEIEMYLIGAIP